MRQVETFHIIVMILLFPTLYNAFFENSQADFTDGFAEQVKTTGLPVAGMWKKLACGELFPQICAVRLRFRRAADGVKFFDNTMRRVRKGRREHVNAIQMGLLTPSTETRLEKSCRSSAGSLMSASCRPRSKSPSTTRNRTSARSKCKARRVRNKAPSPSGIISLEVKLILCFKEAG